MALRPSHVRVLLLAGLVLLGVSLLLGWALSPRRDGSAGEEQQRASIRASEEGPELRGAARARSPSAPDLPAPQAAPQPPGPRGEPALFTVAGENPQTLLTVRLTARGDGRSVGIEEWIAHGSRFPVPPGQVPRLPALPGGWVTLALENHDPTEPAGPYLARTLHLRAPATLPGELHVVVPERAWLAGRPVHLVPIERATGRVVLGASWELPAGDPDVPPLVADARGRIEIPEHLAERAGARAFAHPFELRAGLVLPGWTFETGVDDTFWIEHVIAEREIALPVVRLPSSRTQRRLRLLAPGGAPAAGVRAEIDGRRLRADADGLLHWPMLHVGRDEIRILRSNGATWEWLLLSSDVGVASELRSAQLPDLARVRIVFQETPGRAVPRGAMLSLELEAQQPTWDERAGREPARSGAGAEEDLPSVRLLELETTPLGPEGIDVVVPLERPLRLFALTHPPGEGDATVRDLTTWDLELNVGAQDARIVLDWPPTRVLERVAR